MELLGTAVRRVLADLRSRMDERAGAGIEPSPGSDPRGAGGPTKSLAGKKSGCEGSPAQLAFRQRKGRNKRDKGLPVGRLEAAE